MKNHKTLVWIPPKNSASGAPPPHSMTGEGGHNICISRAKLVILSFSSSYDASTVTDCYSSVFTSVLNHLTYSRNPREESKFALPFRVLLLFCLPSRLQFSLSAFIFELDLPFWLSVCPFSFPVIFPSVCLPNPLLFLCEPF
jgi:hypothetical protein